ncbi:MAG TPA: flagellar hook capping FlgD N-terminal domain-containing protein [Opitutus sp.]|nr:flagellar hook capping FlgD N-terminal domain-containing protein [Opitutus sp.]
MSISSVTSSYSAAGAAEPESATAAKQKKTTLGQEDFLRLLAVQFQSQDPMKPMEDTAFIAQMAQFSALDQSSTLVQQMTQLRSNQDIATANSYLGRQVTLDAGEDQLVTGEVTGIDLTSGSPRLIVGDYTYPISSVLLVEPVPTNPAPNNS